MNVAAMLPVNPHPPPSPPHGSEVDGGGGRAGAAVVQEEEDVDMIIALAADPMLGLGALFSTTMVLALSLRSFYHPLVR